MPKTEFDDHNPQSLATPARTASADTGSPSGDKRAARTPWCSICCSNSPESQERLRELARIGLARLLVTARKARVEITLEQQTDLYETLLHWETGGVPDEYDWLINEYAVRGATYLALDEGCVSKLTRAVESGPRWDARWYLEDPWDYEAERREIERLEALVGDPQPASTAIGMRNEV